MRLASFPFSCRRLHPSPLTFYLGTLTLGSHRGGGALALSTVANRSKSKSKSKSKSRRVSSSSSSSEKDVTGNITKTKTKRKSENEKRRTRSDIEFDERKEHKLHSPHHVPVMLGEVLQVFAPSPHRPPLRSFLDCTLGAAGHSCAIIQSHPALQLYVGLDVDPLAHEIAQTQINFFLNKDSGSNLKVHTHLKNFKDIKSILADIDDELLIYGVDGILMDLGMSSMQVNNAERGFSVLSDGPLDMRMDPLATLKAKDILNSWPEAELGRVLREYGEESNWRSLQTKIVKARLHGGFNSTNDLVNLVRSMSQKSKGRQGWIKTATRVFQALRIAVNDELKTLEDALYACFDCLSSQGRLAVISFHSLEDRIVKQTFLDIINMCDEYESGGCETLSWDSNSNEKEAWIKQRIDGRNGTILTKRPITPSEEEERLNSRCRSAKLRVIQKVKKQ